jgi:hypothetical protein
MTIQTPPRITSADRFSDGVLISFEDGQHAFYSADLLYVILPQAKEIKATDELE